MKLPSIVYQDGIRKGTQVKFGGLNHNLGAGDGELWDMRNLTSDYYPCLPAEAGGGCSGHSRRATAFSRGTP